MLCLCIFLRPKRRWNYARCTLRYVAIIHAIFFLLRNVLREGYSVTVRHRDSLLSLRISYSLDKNPTQMYRGWLFLIVYVYFPFTTELIHHEEINCRASTVIRDSLLYLALWVVHKKLHSTNQSSAHMKPIMTASVAFSRALGSLRVLFF